MQGLLPLLCNPASVAKKSTCVKLSLDRELLLRIHFVKLLKVWLLLMIVLIGLGLGAKLLRSGRACLLILPARGATVQALSWV